MGERHGGVSPAPYFDGKVYVLNRRPSKVLLVGGFGIGAPAMGTAIEELIAMGVRRLIAVGTCGALRIGARPGDIILCTGAIRDEGFSHHYLPPAPLVKPSAFLTAKLRQQLVKSAVPFSKGHTWSIDAPYRETAKEVCHYRDSGVATVEMEAAALFSVAKYRRVQAAAVFTISDTLANLVWEPQFRSVETKDGLDAIVEPAIRALAHMA